jgi:RNA methyltransferase, TrmH family
VKLLTLARDLRRRKGRERQGRFVAEGIRTVEALLQSPVALTGVLFTGAARDDARAAALLNHVEAIGVPSHEISDAEFTSAAETETPQGVLAIAEVPEHALPSPSGEFRILLLDAVQDPGNVGTIVRTAAALGVHFTVALPGTVDLWNAKVVRSAMGALFTHPTAALGWPEVEQFLDLHQIPVWAADMEGHSINSTVTAGPIALAVSNEGNGLSEHVRRRATQLVSIPMSAGVESLNVAVATGILLYALSPPKNPPTHAR